MESPATNQLGHFFLSLGFQKDIFLNQPGRRYPEKKTDEEIWYVLCKQAYGHLGSPKFFNKFTCNVWELHVHLSHLGDMQNNNSKKFSCAVSKDKPANSPSNANYLRILDCSALHQGIFIFGPPRRGGQGG